MGVNELDAGLNAAGRSEPATKRSTIIWRMTVRCGLQLSRDGALCCANTDEIRSYASRLARISGWWATLDSNQ